MSLADRFRSLSMGRRALVLGVVVYLCLSALEFVRILAVAGPRYHDAGFHQWEAMAVDGDMRLYHWTRGDTGHLLRPLQGPVLEMPLYLAHPRLPDQGVTVQIRIGDQRLDELVLMSNGWHRPVYYLPAVLGRQVPAMLPAVAPRDLEETSVPPGGPTPGTWGAPPSVFDGSAEMLEGVDLVRTFSRWRSPGPPSVWMTVEADETFSPADYLDTEDRRSLGVAVGEPGWRAELPPEGAGFHAWEGEGEGRFRWTRSRASFYVEPPSDRSMAVFRVRTAAPDVDEAPVRLRVWWEERGVERLELDTREWTEVRVPVPEATGGVISLQVDRTWIPAREGTSGDQRELGVAVTPVTWE